MALKAAIVIVLASAAATVALARGVRDAGPRAAGSALPATASPRAAPTPRATVARHLLARTPFLGVSCRVPNSIRCDRVGVAVWLRRPAPAVRATVAGRSVALRRHRARLFIGYLRPAGLADGPLRVPFTARGRWYGESAPRVHVRVTAGGRSAAARVPLQAGWG